MEQPNKKAARISGRRCDPTDGIRPTHSSTPAAGFLRVCGYCENWETPRHPQRIVFDVRASHVVGLEQVRLHRRFRVPGQVLERTMLDVLHHGCVVRVVVDRSKACVLAQLALVREGGAL